MDKFDIIIQGGQSNAEGCGMGPDREEYVANPNVLYLEAEKKTTQLPVSCAIEFLDKPYSLTVADYHLDANGDKRGDFALSFANEYIKNGYLKEGRKLLIIRAAVGGTGYKTNQWGKGKILEEKMFELTDYALKLNPENRVVAFLWHQGETEVLCEETGETYKEQFKGTLERVRSTYGKDFPIIAGEFTERFTEQFSKYSAKILPVINEVVNSVENAAVVETKGLLCNDDAVKNGDVYHFSKESLRFLGVRYFDAFKKLKKERGKKMDKFDIIVQAGQSNADGSGRGPVTTEWTPREDICYLIAERKAQWFPDHVEIEFADKPFEISVANERGEENDKVGDFSLTFAEEYVKSGMLQEGRKLLIIRTAVGATCFAKKDWGIEGRLYVKLMEMVDYALSLNPENRIVAFLWHQGESDALDHYAPERYVKECKEMLARFRTRYNAENVPFISGDFVYHWSQSPENKEMCDPIRKAIRQVVAETENTSFVETDGLKSNNEEWGANDFLHFSRESLHKLGRRYFKAYQSMCVKN